MTSVLRTRARRWAAVCIVAFITAGLTAAAWPSRPEAAVRTEVVEIPVPKGPAMSSQITLDAALYLPATTPAPAVLLAHGFGGSRLSVAADAERLAREGFVVLAYSARGFGESEGLISLDNVDYEVADARALVHWLAGRPEVVLDGPDDPRVGVMGGSYGGALALMLAGTDSSVDAVAAIATWNDLEQSLFPNNASVGLDSPTPAAIAPGGDGVFKSAWTAALMSSVIASGLPGVGTAQMGSGKATATCGRLTLELCAAYTEVAETGRLTPAMATLLSTSSPSAVAGDITAPTLLVQGESDTLFGLDQADANAKAIAANGTPVAVTWYAGGHSGSPPDDATADRITDWFRHYLAGQGTTPSTAFRYSVAGPVSERGQPRMRTLELPDYPGLNGIPVARTDVTLASARALVLNPPGGLPAAITSLPGLSGSFSALASLGSLPGQSAVFRSAPLAEPLVVTGSIPITLDVSRLAGTGSDAVLYLSVSAQDGSMTRADSDDTDEDGGVAGTVAAALSGGAAGGAVAAVRLSDLPADGSTQRVTALLPAVAFQVAAGKRLAVQVATTDQGYIGATAPAVYAVQLVDPVLHVPSAGGIRAGGDDDAAPVGLMIGLAALVVVAVAGLALAGRQRRKPVVLADEAGADAAVPLVIESLAKQYPGGVMAVADVSLRVERGQVLGLLGPNGAGKTTTLRMVMGLISPSAGRIAIFGEPAGPGAPVLSRIGSFVEGSGFLPHLSGLANLELYWRATGRPPAQAHMAEALEIAGLGNAVRRKVKTYSQGMRQRLAIAQAMLGLPDLLILDEPTNGLDPPQIHAMREVLRRYAGTGRTVLVSSHLLAEVEQTCTHVVVMTEGRTIASGTVADMVAASGEITVGTPEPERAASYLAAIPGIGEVTVQTASVAVDLADVDLATALAALLEVDVPITSAAPRNRLEDVFLDLVDASAKGAP